MLEYCDDDDDDKGYDIVNDLGGRGVKHWKQGEGIGETNVSVRRYFIIWNIRY